MTCRDLIDFLSDYVDGTLSVDQSKGFAEHLAACRSCRDYLDSYRKTIALEKEAFLPADEPAADRVPADLIKAVLATRRKTPHN